MSEIDRFARLLRGPIGDRLVLIVTFGLTVMVDLTVAIQAGVVLAAILFMHRMSESVIISQTSASDAVGDDISSSASSRVLIRQDQPDATSDRPITREGIPDNLEIYRLSGPLFFGVANRLTDVIDSVAGYPRDFILCMDDVPMIDASGASRIEHFVSTCNRHGTRLFLCGLRPQPQKVLAGMGILDRTGLHVEADIAAALQKITQPSAA
jgi:SulP family sulfate permease